MSQSENIINELEQISETVAGIGSTNVYDIPGDYFISFAANVVHRISLVEESGGLDQYREASREIYAVSPGYFSTFPDLMLDRINETEDQGSKDELFRLSPLLSEVPPHIPYEVPGAYFSELAGEVISGARAIDFVNQELEIESSLLHRVERKNVYTVPAGYFFRLPFSILQKVHGATAKVSVLRKYRKVLSYATAALFAGVMSIATWSYFHQAGTSTVPAVTGMEKIDGEEILKYLETAPVSLSESGYYAATDVKNDEIKRLLADLSNEELQNYIDLNSVSKN